VDSHQNSRFVELMERYFAKRNQQFEEGNTTIDYAPWTSPYLGIQHEFAERFENYPEEKQRFTG
jgi:hypothetical protein